MFLFILYTVRVDISHATTIINCPPNQDCYRECTLLNSCENTIINCPLHKKCTIQCKDAQSCKNTVFNAQHSSLLNITGCAEDQSCVSVSVTCPAHSVHSKNCYIEGNDLDDINIYAANGWNDIEITDIGNDSMHHFGTMHCTPNMSVQCEIAVNDWLCTDTNHVCHDLQTENGYESGANQHLFTLEVSVQMISVFSATVTLSIAGLIICCRIYNRLKTRNKTRKAPMDIIHHINVPTQSPSNAQIVYNHQSSVGNDMHFATHTRQAHTIDISHLPQHMYTSNINMNLYPQTRAASIGTFMANMNNVNGNSMSNSMVNLNSNGSVCASVVTKSTDSPSFRHTGSDNHGNDNSDNDVIEMDHLTVRGRNCTLNDVNINKELPMSPPNSQKLALQIADSEEFKTDFKKGKSDSDSDSELMGQGNTLQGPPPPPPPPVSKHIVREFTE